MTGSTGSERCFWISANPEGMSRFPGSEGKRRLPHSLGFSKRVDLTDSWGSCAVGPAWVSVSGVAVVNMVSSDATVTWIPLDRDSWDFLVNLRSVRVEL